MRAFTANLYMHFDCKMAGHGRDSGHAYHHCKGVFGEINYLLEGALPLRVIWLLTPGDWVAVQRPVELRARLFKLHHAVGAPGVGHRGALTLPCLQEERCADEVKDGKDSVAVSRRSPEGDEVVQETHRGW